jgi:hypothetical protein
MFEEIEISVETSVVLRKEVFRRHGFGGEIRVVSKEIEMFRGLMLMFLRRMLDQRVSFVKSNGSFYGFIFRRNPWLDDLRKRHHAGGSNVLTRGAAPDSVP